MTTLDTSKPAADASASLSEGKLKLPALTALVVSALIAAGVIVRNRSRIPGCEGCLRITVGTPAENARMLETVKNFRL